MLIRYAIALILLVAVHPVFALNDNPCLGPNEILNITNGGGHIFSPCVVPDPKKFWLRANMNIKPLNL